MMRSRLPGQAGRKASHAAKFWRYTDTCSSKPRKRLGDMEFRESWISLLFKAATGTKTIRTLLTPLGIMIFAVFTALFVFVAVLVDRLLHLSLPFPEGVRFPLSVLAMAVGITVMVWSAFHFLKVKGTPAPFNPPPQVVKNGLYRYTRNPMLTGVFLFLFGLGFAINSASLVFFFTPLFVLFNVWELKQIEEPELMKRLGDEYIEYRKQTPMFLPVLRPKAESKRLLF